MYEWIRSGLLLADGVMDNGLGSPFYYGVGLTIVILASWMATKKDDRALQKLYSRAFKNAARSEHLSHSALKTCPKCSVQVPLTTLVCDACDFNFLSGCVGTRHKLLPAPETATLTR
jgi:hypothetical protein